MKKSTKDLAWFMVIVLTSTAALVFIGGLLALAAKSLNG